MHPWLLQWGVEEHGAVRCFGKFDANRSEGAMLWGEGKDLEQMGAGEEVWQTKLKKSLV